MRRARLTKAQYEMLAAFRHALRKFQRFSEDAAVSAGVTPQQHQALLAIKGFPGRNHVSIGELAEQLQLRHHSTVGLVDRLARQSLVRREVSEADRRRVDVLLTPEGEELLLKLSEAHMKELRHLGPQLQLLLSSIEN